MGHPPDEIFYDIRFFWNDIGDHARKPCRLRFNEDQTKPFIQGRKKERIHGRHESWNIRPDPCEEYAVGEPGFSNSPFDITSQWTISDKQERHIPFTSGKFTGYFNHERMIFLLIESTDMSDNQGINRDAQFRSYSNSRRITVGLKRGQVNGIRNNPPRPSVLDGSAKQRCSRSIRTGQSYCPVMANGPLH